MADMNKDLFSNDGLDLGSEGSFEPFNPLDFDQIFGKEESTDGTEVITPPPVEAFASGNAKFGTPKKDDKPTGEHAEATSTPDGQVGLFEAAIAKAEDKQAATEKDKLAGKLPIFSYGDAKEEIVDTSITFDKLREEKADDFPELDDYSSVSWKMVYGTITKAISTPKKTTIASVKKQIEESKDFVAAIKKAKGEIECNVMPSVTAKKKGRIPHPYKGIYLSVEEARRSGKIISFVPSKEGDIYEVRANKVGTFIAKTENVSVAEEVRAGFIPALPKIPYGILSQIIAFFKSYVKVDSELEALAYIYWSFEESKYEVYIPKQTVSKASVDSNLLNLDDERFALVMEIHSHNTMSAVFSPTDDRDERATRLYTVVGRLDKIFPDINTRISVGRNFVEIDPTIVFEGFSGSYPNAWHEAVVERARKVKGTIE